jgi:hypothetical protein
MVGAISSNSSATLSPHPSQNPSSDTMGESKYKNFKEAFNKLDLPSNEHLKKVWNTFDNLAEEAPTQEKELKKWIKEQVHRENISAFVLSVFPASGTSDSQVNTNNIIEGLMLLESPRFDQIKNDDNLTRFKEIYEKLCERVIKREKTEGKQVCDPATISTFAADIAVKKLNTNSLTKPNITEDNTIDLLGGDKRKIIKAENWTDLAEKSGLKEREAKAVVSLGGGSDVAGAAAIAAQFPNSVFSTSIQPLSPEKLKHIEDKNGGFHNLINTDGVLTTKSSKEDASKGDMPQIYPNPFKELKAIDAVNNIFSDDQAEEKKELTIFQVNASSSNGTYTEEEVDRFLFPKPDQVRNERDVAIENTYKQVRDYLFESKVEQVIANDTGGDVCILNKWGRDQMMLAFLKKACGELGKELFLFVQSPGVDQEANSFEVIAELTKLGEVYEIDTNSKSAFMVSEEKGPTNFNKVISKYNDSLDQENGTLNIAFETLHEEAKLPTCASLFAEQGDKKSRIVEAVRSFVPDKRAEKNFSELKSAYLVKLDLTPINHNSLAQ